MIPSSTDDGPWQAKTPTQLTTNSFKNLLTTINNDYSSQRTSLFGSGVGMDAGSMLESA